MKEENGKQEISLSEKEYLKLAYEKATEHWIHAEETRWTLLYNYFMGSW